MTWEKIKVITNMINKGFIIAQEMPKEEPMYLPLKFFITILLIICLFEITADSLFERFIISPDPCSILLQKRKSEYTN
jgi:hypothetical protein